MAVALKKVAEEGQGGGGDDADFNSGFETETNKAVATVVSKEGAVASGGTGAAPIAQPPTGGVPSTAQPPTAGAGATPAGPAGLPGAEGKPAAAAPRTPANQLDPGDEPVTISKKVFDRLVYAADLAISNKANLDKLNGTVGSQEARIKQIVNPTIELSDEDFKDLAKDFPEIAAATKTGLSAILKRLGKTVQPGATKDDIKAAVFERTVQIEMDALEDAYPNWREIIGTPNEKGEVPKDNRFRKWLDTQPAAYRDRVLSTYSSQIMTRAIQRFMVTQKTAAAPPTPRPRTPANQGQGARQVLRTAARRDRLTAAIQPRGDGGANPSRQKSEDDEFAEGFQSG